MLNQSQLTTFIDPEKKFALYFLEGQKLIHDLVMTHHLNSMEFSYFRTMVLSVQLMLGLLKQGEYFCFYIDSEIPYFRLKIEMNNQGLMRGMIYSDNLDAAPDTVTGTVRMVKFQPNSDMPYQSAIDIDNVGPEEIINRVLERSYQVKSRIFVSKDSDQSFMLHQLPLTVHEDPSDLDESYASYISSIKGIMKKGLTDAALIKKAFEKTEFNYLARQGVEFKCGCSRQQMINNVIQFSKSDNKDPFVSGLDELEVVCEYCKTAYRITQKDINKFSSEYQ